MKQQIQKILRRVTDNKTRIVVSIIAAGLIAKSVYAFDAAAIVPYLQTIITQQKKELLDVSKQTTSMIDNVNQLKDIRKWQEMMLGNGFKTLRQRFSFLDDFFTDYSVTSSDNFLDDVDDLQDNYDEIYGWYEKGLSDGESTRVALRKARLMQGADQQSRNNQLVDDLARMAKAAQKAGGTEAQKMMVETGVYLGGLLNRLVQIESLKQKSEVIENAEAEREAEMEEMLRKARAEVWAKYSHLERDSAGNIVKVRHGEEVSETDEQKKYISEKGSKFRFAHTRNGFVKKLIRD